MTKQTVYEYQTINYFYIKQQCEYYKCMFETIGDKEITVKKQVADRDLQHVIM